MTVVSVRNSSAKRRKEEYRKLRREPDHSQQHDRTGQSVDQPTLRNGLHPRAGQRNDLARKEELKVSVTKCAERRREAGALCFLFQIRFDVRGFHSENYMILPGHRGNRTTSHIP